jgi:hypothetical protein
VGKGTILSILALLDFVREAVTEFSLVLVFMIESFDPIMSSATPFLFGTFLRLSKLTKLWRIVVIISSLVLDGVVVIATLVIVWCILLRTFDPLKVGEIQMFDDHGLASSMVGLGDSQKDVFVLKLLLMVNRVFFQLTSFHLSSAHIILTNLIFRLLIVKTFLKIGLFSGILNQSKLF